MRHLKTFERTLGKYRVAGAIYSYGDVIDFVDGEKQGIIIADTCGKRRDYGNKAKKFLKEKIKEGWGSSKDAKTEILDLGRRLALAGTGKAHFEAEYSSEQRWWDCIEFCYAHFDNDLVSLSGLRHLIFREEGNTERYNSTLGPYHFEDPGERETAKTDLNGNDVLMIASDGLEFNIRLLYRTSKELEEYYEAPKKIIKKIVYENIKYPVDQIRDSLILKLSDYLTGGFFSKDDVTFALVKKVIPNFK
ncbi:MAG: hypothetical protein KKA62_06125 [Nanoarchaeota archaeon]|nr:hypothetical protein [Nanoarchaeota archaeon]MBU1644414.1 hypothetical protein [Nanoarchaeota archaeon]MBU1977502.1 hypothetical protein [Nanoarchaeota archaeon]